MRTPTLSLIAICLSGAALADCPAAPDIGDELEALAGQVRAAEDEQAARLITNRMWELWATAPDDHAQQLLDHGMTRRASYDFVAAVEALDELVAYCPDYAEGYNQRAFVNFLRQDYRSALEDLERTLEIQPFHPPALAGKALTLMGLGRIDEGQEVLREALQLNPWLPERGMLIEPPGEEL